MFLLPLQNRSDWEEMNSIVVLWAKSRPLQIFSTAASDPSHLMSLWP